jgi:hypothetical protein
VQKKDYKMKLQGDKLGRKGHLSVSTEVFEVAPSLFMVELQKNSGDTLEYNHVSLAPFTAISILHILVESSPICTFMSCNEIFLLMNIDGRLVYHLFIYGMLTFLPLWCCSFTRICPRVLKTLCGKQILWKVLNRSRSFRYGSKRCPCCEVATYFFPIVNSSVNLR